MSTNTSAETFSNKDPTNRSCELKISPRRKSLDAELCGLGRTLRHLQPPGGNESGIFDAFRLPPVILTPSGKVKEYTESHVFSTPKSSPPRPVTPYKDTTHYKLFAMSPPQAKPRRYKMTYSTVFDFNSIPAKRLPPAKKTNPITGEACPSRDPDVHRRMPNKRNPITFEGIVERRTPSSSSSPVLFVVCMKVPNRVKQLIVAFNIKLHIVGINFTLIPLAKYASDLNIKMTRHILLPAAC
ncbi:hypothetical protein AVEN_191886-1 [Araneus ventricosus]|uniref:Uncharacterized protein n=1 Tax=Araneus ventricosus TaxID=182803 RepID=A0A4Y2K9N7_ARAVE|nr:hypothetical protein AVEN_191886-1 [Araneus ventricosus]